MRLWLCPLALLLAIQGLEAASQDAALPDAAVGTRVEAITAQLREKKIAPDDVIDPALVTDQMEALDSLIATSADARSPQTLKARIIRALLLQNEGQNARCESELQAVLPDAGTGEAAQAAYMILGSAYQKQGRAEKLTALAAQSQAAGMPPTITQSLQGMLTAVGIAPGKPFPAFTVTDTAGTAHTLASYKGSVVLVEFWATAFEPCVKEMYAIMQIYGLAHTKGLEVLSISLDQDRTALDAFVTSKGIPWPQCLDDRHVLATRLAIHTIPTCFLIGADGMLIARDLRGADLTTAVKQALNIR